MRLEVAIEAFLRELREFTCELSVSDRVWNVLFPGIGKKWHHLHINKYGNIFFITQIGSNDTGLEVEPKKGIRAMDQGGFSSFSAVRDDQFPDAWEHLIPAARRWLETSRKDWIKANRRIQEEYPLNLRYGFAPHSVIRALLPEWYRLDAELGKTLTRKLVRLVEDGYALKSENTIVPSMSAADYFEYCRIAYLAGKRKGETIDDSLSGREMYACYADGRHEGLLDIDQDSVQEFSDWLDGKHPARQRGGHPWEIKRGGNTTHIDLSVSRPFPNKMEGFKVELRGESIGRMAETIRMFLAIYDEGLPIAIADLEDVRKRLLGLDNIGLIPAFQPLHRANQHFNQGQDVFDVMHYDDLGRFKRRIAPFITWEALPILKPKGR